MRRHAGPERARGSRRGERRRVSRVYVLRRSTVARQSRTADRPFFHRVLSLCRFRSGVCTLGDLHASRLRTWMRNTMRLCSAPASRSAFCRACCRSAASECYTSTATSITAANRPPSRPSRTCSGKQNVQSDLSFPSPAPGCPGFAEAHGNPERNSSRSNAFDADVANDPRTVFSPPIALYDIHLYSFFSSSRNEVRQAGNCRRRQLRDVCYATSRLHIRDHQTPRDRSLTGRDRFDRSRATEKKAEKEGGGVVVEGWGRCSRGERTVSSVGTASHTGGSVSILEAAFTPRANQRRIGRVYRMRSPFNFRRAINRNLRSKYNWNAARACVTSGNSLRQSWLSRARILI